MSAADAAEAQKKLTSKIRSKYERSQLVESFCTDRDDVIRLTDRPERFQDIMAGRSIPGDEERSEEAEWMATKLAEKIISGKLYLWQEGGEKGLERVKDSIGTEIDRD